MWPACIPHNFASSMRHLLFHFAVSCLTAAILIEDAFAGLSMPESRAIHSPNGQFLLVLLTPKQDRGSRAYSQLLNLSWPELHMTESNALLFTQELLEATYPQSGLYRNDGSTSLLWPLNYQSTTKDIFVCDDAVHMIVAFLNWSNENASDRGNALEFYRNGQLLAAYQEDDLLSAYAARIIACRLTGSELPTCASATLDEKAKTFSLTTDWGDSFQFDITSGRMIQSKQSPVTWIPWLMTLTVAVPAGMWFYHNRSKSKIRDRS